MRRRRIPWLWIIGGVLALGWLGNLANREPPFTERYEQRTEQLENDRLRIWVLADSNFEAVAQECLEHYSQRGAYCFVFSDRRYWEPNAPASTKNFSGESSCYRAVAVRYLDGELFAARGDGCE